MGQWFEDFSTRYQHTIALLSSVGTVLAVIVALSTSYAAKRASRPKLRGGVDVSFLFDRENLNYENVPFYVTVKVTNTGMVPIRLQSTFFSWRLPFYKGAWVANLVMEHGDLHIHSMQFPIIIFPNTSESIFICSQDSFKENFAKIRNRNCLSKISAPRLLRAYIYTDNGSNFRASLHKSLKDELKLLSR